MTTCQSRRGRPVQAQKASARVSRGVRSGSATAKVGSRSTSGVSQVSRPASTSGGRQQRAEGLGDRADAQQRVGVDWRRLALRADAEPLQEGDLATLDDGDGGAGDADLGQLRRDVGLERGQPLAGQWQRRHTSQVGHGAWVGWGSRCRFLRRGRSLNEARGEEGRRGHASGRLQRGTAQTTGRALTVAWPLAASTSGSEGRDTTITPVGIHAEASWHRSKW